VCSGLASRDYQFKINSLFDPDFTGTGHQPKGFDQLAALYQRYRVYRVKYQIDFVSIGNTTPGYYPLYLGVAPTNSLTGFTSISDHMETPFAHHRLYQGVASDGITGSSALKGSVDLAKLNGKTRMAYDADDTTQALVSTSPTEIIHLHVMMQSLDNSTNFAGYFTVKLSFDVEFTDPVQLAQS
jgi:hypothetical protein